LVDPGISAAKTKPDHALILQDPTKHKDRASLWNAHAWKKREDVKVVEHECSPYHGGCHTIAQLRFSHISPQAQEELQCFQDRRDLTSPFDEMIFYWTKAASKDLIEKAITESSNVTYFLLKHIAQHWINQLELINCTLANGEYFSDDYQAKIDDTLDGQQWMADLIKVTAITKDINYIRRQMNHFWRATVLNMECLGIQIGCEHVDATLSEALAIQGAQKDFLNIHSRMQLLRQRVEALTDIANQLANLRAAFKSTYDGELGMRLSIFASVVFPFTLVAGILSMNDDFLPGTGKFWIFWVGSIPSVLVASILLLYGPKKIAQDLIKVIKTWHERKRLAVPGPDVVTYRVKSASDDV
jgi:CorA-like Mg2+ transporter protein